MCHRAAAAIQIPFYSFLCLRLKLSGCDMTDWQNIQLPLQFVYADPWIRHFNASKFNMTSLTYSHLEEWLILEQWEISQVVHLSLHKIHHDTRFSDRSFISVLDFSYILGDWHISQDTHLLFNGGCAVKIRFRVFICICLVWIYFRTRVETGLTDSSTLGL